MDDNLLALLPTADIWTDIKGTAQQLSNTMSRLRSAAFPYDLAYRLINMYSVKGDPGTG